MDFIRKNGKGILVCLCIAVPSWLLGKRFPIVGGPVIAIIAGMILTLLIKDKKRLEGGIKYTSKKILQYAVILLGFGLNLQVILQTPADRETVAADYCFHHRYVFDHRLCAS